MGGKIYVTGEVGRDGGDDGGGRNSVSYVCVYDPQADAWTQLASISTDRLSHTSAAVGGKLYVFGGSSTEGDLGTAEVYGPASELQTAGHK